MRQKAPIVPAPFSPRRKVERSDILDYETYDNRRAAMRAVAMEVKRRRRVCLGPYLTFLFENRATIRYQIQETVHTEHLVREADIQHEIDTYNALVAGPGELACCLLIEIEDAAQRQRCLREWRGLPGHVYLRCQGNLEAPDEQPAIVRADFDPEQMGSQLSSVHHLRFRLGALLPVAVGCDLPALAGPKRLEAALSEEQRDALVRDLRRGSDHG